MDTKPHLEKLEKLGLVKAEETLEGVVEVLFEMVDEYVAETENTMDDLAYAALKGLAMEMVKELVDKVDGEEG